MMFDLFFRRWTTVSLGLVLGVVGHSQALGQSDVESFIRKVNGLKSFLKADEGVTTKDHSAKGGQSSYRKISPDHHPLLWLAVVQSQIVVDMHHVEAHPYIQQL
jgi:hypothetical protein